MQRLERVGHAPLASGHIAGRRFKDRRLDAVIRFDPVLVCLARPGRKIRTSKGMRHCYAYICERRSVSASCQVY